MTLLFILGIQFKSVTTLLEDILDDKIRLPVHFLLKQPL